MKKVFIGIIILILTFGLYKLLSRGPNDQIYDNPDLVMYWGVGCDHCETVKDYIKDNNINSKLKINQKEIFYNKQNQSEAQQQVKQFCPQIDNGQGFGVPLSIDPQSNLCILGSDEIIKFIEEKASQSQ